jgi:hypothetical protein
MPTLTDGHWELIRADLKKDYETGTLLRIKKLLKEVGLQVVPFSEHKEKPKPESSRKKQNVSEVAMSYRVNYLKLILGERLDRRPIEVLNLASTVLETHRDQCKRGLFIDCKSSGLLRTYGSKLEGLSAEVDSLNPAYMIYEEWHPEPNDPIPEELRIKAISQAVIRFANSGAEPKELGWKDILETARATLSKRTVMKCYASLNSTTGILRLHETSAAKLKCSKIKAQAASRNDVLRATIAAMAGIRQIRETCYFHKVDHEVERLYVVCAGLRADLFRGTSFRLLANRLVISDPEKNPESIDRLVELIFKIKDIFYDALQRQRLSPFSTVKLNHLPRIPSGGFDDGQVGSGAWDNEERHLSWKDRILRELEFEIHLGNSKMEKSDLIERVWKSRPEAEALNSKSTKKSGISGIYKALSELCEKKRIVISKNGFVRLKSISARRK